MIGGAHRTAAVLHRASCAPVRAAPSRSQRVTAPKRATKRLLDDEAARAQATAAYRMLIAG